MNILYAVTAEAANRRPDGRVDIIGVHQAVGVAAFPARVSPFIAVLCHASDYDRMHPELEHSISLHVGRGEEGDETGEIAKWTQGPMDTSKNIPGQQWTYTEVPFQPEVNVTAPITLHFEIRVDGVHWGRLPYSVYDLANPFP